MVRNNGSKPNGEENRTTGMLSNEDFDAELENHGVFIHPFEPKNLTGVGYNLTPSDFVFSTRRGELLEVVHSGNSKYVWVPANDTVLILTREYVSISPRLAGTFHSRVRIVSQGFGHISTTLDPGWKGPLLFALNNPSRKRKLILRGTSMKGAEENTFVTMILYYLNMETKRNHDNLPFRFDVLEQWYDYSSWMRKQFSKSHLLLKDIISTAKKMSPDNPLELLTPTIFDKLKEYLTKKLDDAGTNQNKLAAELQHMDIIFADARNVCSSIFLRQLNKARDCAKSITEGGTATGDLLHIVALLIEGCNFENRRIRWDRCSEDLTCKISSYRASRLLNLTLHLRENTAMYVLILLAVLFGVFLSLREEIVFEAIVTLVVAICSLFIAVFKRSQ